METIIGEEYRDYKRDPFPHSLLSTRPMKLLVLGLGF